MDLLDRSLLLAVALVVVAVTGVLWRRLEHARRRHGFDAPRAARSEAERAPGSRRDGRTDDLLPPLLPEELRDALGRAATFVVVGTRGCSDCARTLAVLRRELADEPGVAVAHVLAPDAPALVERFAIRTAPTVVLAGADGEVVGVHPGPVDADVARGAVAALRGGEAGGRPFPVVPDRAPATASAPTGSLEGSA